MLRQQPVYDLKGLLLGPLVEVCLIWLLKPLILGNVFRKEITNSLSGN